jgi:hypothetical protein
LAQSTDLAILISTSAEFVISNFEGADSGICQSNNCASRSTKLDRCNEGLRSENSCRRLVFSSLLYASLPGNHRIEKWRNSFWDSALSRRYLREFIHVSGELEVLG